MNMKTNQIKHYGKLYTVVASFPVSPEGEKDANEFITNNPGTGVLCVGDMIYIANNEDKGVMP